MDEDQWEAASESLSPFLPLFSTRPWSGFGSGGWGGGCSAWCICIGLSFLCLFCRIPPSIFFSRSAIPRPGCCSSFLVVICFHVASPQPHHARCMLSHSGLGGSLCPSFLLLFMTRMLGRTGNTKSGVCRFFTLPSVRSLYAFIFCLPFFSLSHLIASPPQHYPLSLIQFPNTPTYRIQ